MLNLIMLKIDIIMEGKIEIGIRLNRCRVYCGYSFPLTGFSPLHQSNEECAIVNHDWFLLLRI